MNLHLERGQAIKSGGVHGFGGDVGDVGDEVLQVATGLLQVGGVDDDLHQLWPENKQTQSLGAVSCHAPRARALKAFASTSVKPMWGFLMRFCRELLSVLVRSRLVDFRNMSSISVELESPTFMIGEGVTGRFTPGLHALSVDQTYLRCSDSENLRLA